MNWLKFHAQFYGITQTGKTTLALQWLSSHDGLRIFIDTKAETYTKKKFKKQFDIIAPLADIKIILQNFRDFQKRGVKIALIPNNMRLNKEMKIFCEEIWKVKMHNIFKTVILFDEIQEYSCIKVIRSLFLQGLSKQLICGLTSQGWSQVNKNIRNNCELTVLLKQKKNDINSLMEQGLLPYELDERGWRVCKIKFKKKYEAFAEIGTGGKFVKVQ